MSRYNIYIDFEAIDSSLTKVLKLNIDFVPFCYTIGTYTKDNKFITITTVLDMKKINSHNAYFLMSERLKKDIRKLFNIPDMMINNRTIKFIGWNPSLENKITMKIFKMPTYSQVKYDGVSLDTMCKNGNFNNNYFADVAATKTKNKLHTRTMKLNKSGCTASYVGYVLFKYFKSQKLHKLEMNSAMANSWLCNLKIYSNDDVVKMHYVNKNFEIVSAKINKVKMLRKKIQDNNNNLRLFSIFVVYLKGFYKKKNPEIASLKEDLEKLAAIIKDNNVSNSSETEFKIKIDISHIYKLIALIDKIKLKNENLEGLLMYLEKKVSKFKGALSKDKENLESTLFKE